MIKKYIILIVICMVSTSIIFAQANIDFSGHSEGPIDESAYTAQGITKFYNGYYFNNHLSINIGGTPLTINFQYTQSYVKLTLVVSGGSSNETLSAWTGTDGTGSQVGSSQIFSSIGEYTINGSGIRSVKITQVNSSFYNEYNYLKYDSPLPVELTSFTALANGNLVSINWATATEVNNYGFQVESKKEKVESNWEKIGFVKGCGNSNSPKEYSFVDKTPPSGKVLYRLQQIDNDGSFKYYGPVEVMVSVAQFSLKQNYPNPFNPVTTINYSLPEKALVNLTVYDVLGRNVANLVNKEQESGVYNVEFNGSNLNSGIYFYELRAGKFSEVKKLLLVK